MRQRQRPGQPPAARRVHPKPDLLRDRGPGLRDHHLDATARAERAPISTVGTQTAPAAPVVHRRATSHHRPTPHPPPVHPRALDPTGAPRPDHPARPDRPPRPQRITLATPSRRPSTTPGVEPGATQATSGDLSHPHSTITSETGRTRPDQDPNERRETSRLVGLALLDSVRVGTELDAATACAPGRYCRPQDPCH
jgi:hypothetical protein